MFSAMYDKNFATMQQSTNFEILASLFKAPFLMYDVTTWQETSGFIFSQ